MSSAGWLGNSWLVEHKTSAEEIAGLLAIVARDLANARLAGLAERLFAIIGFRSEQNGQIRTP